MKRREFITLLGGAATASLSHSLSTLAQQTQTPIRIGVLPFGSPSNTYDQSLVDAFRSGLRQAGLIEGRDIVLDIVWASGSDADTDKAVTDLIRKGSALLVRTGSTAGATRLQFPLCSSVSAIPSPWGWSKTSRIRAATPLVSATSFQT